MKAEVLMPHGVIRDLGEFDSSLDLGYDVSASISLSVIGLQSSAAVSDDGSVIEEFDESDEVSEKSSSEDDSNTDSSE